MQSLKIAGGKDLSSLVTAPRGLVKPAGAATATCVPHAPDSAGGTRRRVQGCGRLPRISVPGGSGARSPPTQPALS